MRIAARWMLVLAASGLAQGAGATLTADYQFQNTLSSSVAGAPDLANIGPGTNAFALDTPSGATVNVLTFPQGNGVVLTPTTGLTDGSTYTIVMLVKLTSVTGYRRYTDFKNGTADTGLYNLNGALNFYNHATGPTQPITAGTYRQIVVTRDGTNVTGYVDGVQQLTYADSSTDGVISAANTLRFFIDDNVVSGENSAGAVARIRIYNTALSANEVAALDGAAVIPPPAPRIVPTLSPAALLALALLLGLAGWTTFRTGRRRA